MQPFLGAVIHVTHCTSKYRIIFCQCFWGIHSVRFWDIFGMYKFQNASDEDDPNATKGSIDTSFLTEEAGTSFKSGQSDLEVEVNCADEKTRTEGVM